ALTVPHGDRLKPPSLSARTTTRRAAGPRWAVHRRQHGPTLGFEVADVLALGREPTFDTILDSGLFHVFDDDARDRYVTSLASLLRTGGNCYLMCFSDRQPGDLGPRRVRRDEITTAFRDGWIVEGIVPDAFEINPPLFGTSIAQAWLASIRRQPLVANADSARLSSA
ncbi:MAG TPA: class I SAM-dependent methyltransferase, partial [Kineosporiaceae bacterium]|nr:class I SAM-dependent methyltransferase [Kineosporiaceae bacterium]